MALNDSSDNEAVRSTIGDRTWYPQKQKSNNRVTILL